MALHSLQQYRKHRTIQRMVQWCRRKDRKIEQAQGRKEQAPSINRHSAGARIGRQSKRKGERSKHHRSIGIVQAQGQEDRASTKEREASTIDQQAQCRRKDRKMEQAQRRKKQAPSIKKHGTSAKIGTSISMAQVLRRKELAPSRSQQGEASRDWRDLATICMWSQKSSTHRRLNHQQQQTTQPL